MGTPAPVVDANVGFTKAMSEGKMSAEEFKAGIEEFIESAKDGTLQKDMEEMTKEVDNLSSALSEYDPVLGQKIKMVGTAITDVVDHLRSKVEVK